MADSLCCFCFFLWMTFNADIWERNIHLYIIYLDAWDINKLTPFPVYQLSLCEAPVMKNDATFEDIVGAWVAHYSIIWASCPLCVWIRPVSDWSSAGLTVFKMLCGGPPQQQ